MNLDRSKIVAIVTGAIALILGIAYLTVVQLLDFRGEMIPAPQSQLPNGPELVINLTENNPSNLVTLL